MSEYSQFILHLHRKGALGKLLTQRTTLVHLGFSLVILLSLASCSGGSSLFTHNTPAPDTLPSPQQVLTDAAQSLSSLQWIGFLLDHEQGTTSMSYLGLDLLSVKGQIALPNRYQVTVEASPHGRTGYMELEAIVIGDQAYLQLFGHWGEADSSTLPFRFKDLGHVLGDILLAIPEPVHVGVEELGDRMDYIHMKGTIASQGLQPLITNADDGHPVEIQVWVRRDDWLPYKTRLAGQVYDDDDADVVRVLTLYDFNVPVDIEPPPL